MIRVLLVHAGLIPHYRIPIYGYLSKYLKRYGFEVTVASDGVQAGTQDPIEFPFAPMHLSALNIARFIQRQQINIIIDFMELKHRYLFPTYLIAKGILRRKMVYWGQGRDLLDPKKKIKNLAYAAEQAMCNAIILYAEHLKKYVPKIFHKKVFIANNTLHLTYKGLPLGVTRENVLAEYGISTKKNIICIGRMQKRKRLDQLVRALVYLNRKDIGLILVGPDPDGVLDKIEGDNIFKLAPIYGDKKLALLYSADVYCLPGAVGLSIVDAFYCGLPFVTEEGDESAETMYLRNGINGFIVPKDNIPLLSQKLLLLLDDDELRRRFSDAAKREIEENGNIDIFCSGFKDALFYVTGQTFRKNMKINKWDSG
jgi:glycosyltransferase involved in cell wall biosynthesis